MNSARIAQTKDEFRTNVVRLMRPNTNMCVRMHIAQNNNNTFEFIECARGILYRRFEKVPGCTVRAMCVECVYMSLLVFVDKRELVRLW